MSADSSASSHRDATPHAAPNAASRAARVGARAVESHPSNLRLLANPRLRPGSVIKSLLTTLCGGVMLLTAAAVLDPATLQADSSLPNPAPDSRDRARNDVLRDLASLLGEAHQVLLIRPAYEDRGCEVVLWLNDTRDPDRINPSELALLRHSPLFQTLTLYTLATANDHQPGISQQPGADRQEPTTLTLQTIASPGFIDRWRAETSVGAKVLATGISDMRLDAIGDQRSASSNPHAVPNTSSAARSSSRPDLSPLHVHLTYAGDSVDGETEASATIVPTRLAPPMARPPATPAAHRPGPQQEYTP